MARRSFSALLVSLSLLFAAGGCGHAETPAPPVVAPPPTPPAPPTPPSGPRACHADSDCTGATHAGTGWRCLPLAMLAEESHCQEVWPDATVYCDTLADCPVHPENPDFAWDVACTDHHCIETGHPTAGGSGLGLTGTGGGS